MKAPLPKKVKQKKEYLFSPNRERIKLPEHVMADPLLSEEFQRPEHCNTKVFKKLENEIGQIYAKIYDKNKPISHEEAESLNAHLHYMYRSGDIKK